MERYRASLDGWLRLLPNMLERYVQFFELSSRDWNHWHALSNVRAQILILQAEALAVNQPGMGFAFAFVCSSTYEALLLFISIARSQQQMELGHRKFKTKELEKKHVDTLLKNDLDVLSDRLLQTKLFCIQLPVKRPSPIPDDLRELLKKGGLPWGAKDISSQEQFFLTIARWFRNGVVHSGALITSFGTMPNMPVDFFLHVFEMVCSSTFHAAGNELYLRRQNANPIQP